MKQIILIIISILILSLAVGFLSWNYRIAEKPTILPVNNFEECAAKGYPILESYPRQCKTPDGKIFVEDIGNELEKQELIQVSNPRPNELIKSPLEIKGKARGYWFFEASFPIKLVDENKKELGRGIAQALSDWMTQDFVPFRATLEFQTPATKKGTLILEKDNPSGLPEYADELRIPVFFSPEPKRESLREINLYYYNQVRDKEIAEYIPCSPDAVLPLPRKISFTNTPIQDSIRLLLEGNLTTQEKAAGFTTEFPLPGFRLFGANLKEEVLTLEFDDPMQKTVGGSCRVRLLWAQIEKTAKQFPEVKEVKFSPEFLFQP